MTYTAQPLPGYKCLVNLASGSTAGTNLLLTNAGDNQTFTVPLADTHRYLDRAVAPTVQVAYDDIQTLTVTGGPTGGTVVLRWGGNNTGAIAYNASAATVQAALQALAGVGAGQVAVSGPAGGPWVVEWTGTLADAAQALITLQTNSLTGGSSPSVNIVHTQTGQAYTTISSTTYSLRNLTARVVLNAALPGSNVLLRLSAFNYYPYAAIVQAWDITLAIQTAMLGITAFQGSAGAGFYSCIPGVTKGTFACKSWQPAPGSDIYLAHLVARDLLILSLVDANGVNAAEAYVYTDASTLLASLTSVAEEDLSFMCDSLISLI